MTMETGVADVFWRDDEIPEGCRIDAPLHQDSILIDGELVRWKGATRSIRSAIVVGDANGAFAPQSLGSVPDAGLPEALRALSAAETAYDNGRGTWPTMRVAQRIACVEEFTRQLLANRTEIVRLIMWEIGKTLKDSEKEFDRTIAYIRDTIAELKKLDNAGSRFPFAGRKDSAEGTLSVHDALRAFSIRSMVSTKVDEAGKQLIGAIVQSNASRFINTNFIL
jgi:glyceraldehyde-3-phosphate dehydrogenase (NADP+)